MGDRPETTHLLQTDLGGKKTGIKTPVSQSPISYLLGKVKLAIIPEIVYVRCCTQCVEEHKTLSVRYQAIFERRPHTLIAGQAKRWFHCERPQ